MKISADRFRCFGTPSRFGTLELKSRMHECVQNGEAGIEAADTRKRAEGRRMMEKVYRTMRNTGAANIAVGIIMIVAGLGAGIVAIVSGAVLLKRKAELTF